MAAFVDLSHNLVHSIPRRMRAIVNAGDLWTKYWSLPQTFLNFIDKYSWQFVKKFAYASFANLLLPIIRRLLLGMAWPVYKNNSLFTSSKGRKISNINKQNICKKYINKKKRPMDGISISSTNYLH